MIFLKYPLNWLRIPWGSGGIQSPAGVAAHALAGMKLGARLGAAAAAMLSSHRGQSSGLPIVKIIVKIILVLGVRSIQHWSRRERQAGAAAPVAPGSGGAEPGLALASLLSPLLMGGWKFLSVLSVMEISPGQLLSQPGRLWGPILLLLARERVAKLSAAGFGLLGTAHCESIFASCIFSDGREGWRAASPSGTVAVPVSPRVPPGIPSTQALPLWGNEAR